MKILITGSTGFIGSNLVQYLNTTNNIELLTPTRSELALENHYTVRLYMNTHKPDVIVHLAANPNNKPNINDPTKILYDNIIATHNLCYYAPQGCRFIFASSISVYGPTPYPKKENDDCIPGTMYGVTKLSCEKIVELYTKQTNINGVCLRFCATVGPNMTHGMLYDFYRKAKIVDSDEFEVFGNRPGSTKPYIYVNDVIKVIIYMINQPYITYPINILPDELLSVEQIANTFLNITETQKRLKWLGDSSTWAGDEHILQASNVLMKNTGIVLDYKTSYQAILHTIKNYKDNKQ